MNKFLKSTPNSVAKRKLWEYSWAVWQVGTSMALAPECSLILAEMYLLKACTCVYANPYLTETNHSLIGNGHRDPKLCEQTD